MPDVHVVPAGDQWACEINGNARSTHDTQDEAIKHGRRLAEEQASELVVHAQDGSIREKDSHGTTRATFPASQRGDELRAPPSGAASRPLAKQRRVRGTACGRFRAPLAI